MMQRVWNLFDFYLCKMFTFLLTYLLNELLTELLTYLLSYLYTECELDLSQN